MAAEHFENAFYVDHKTSSDVFLLALLELMKEKAYSDISISELCRKADLSRNTFYKFFPEKNALLEYLKEDIALGFVAYKETIAKEKLSSSMEAFVHYFSFWYQLREWVDVLVENEMWEQIAMPNDKELALLSNRNWDRYLLQTEQTMEMMRTFVAAGCVQLVKWWSRNNYEKTPEEMAELVSYIISGHLRKSKTTGIQKKQ